MFGDKIKKFGKIIKRSKNILLISHIRMDPDTFGSMGALYYILESMGKNVKATNDDPAPDSFGFMGANSIVKTNIDFEKFNPDLIISLDAASLGQLGKVYSENSSFFEKNFVVIDHHVTNKGYGTHNIIDKDVSSACELLYKIIIKLKYKKYLTPKIATLLLSGILTDTNVFYNANTTPKTLKVASELLEYKAKSREAMFNFFKKRTFNKSKMWGEALKNLKETSSGKIIRLTINKEIFKKTHTSDRETSGLINEFLSNIEGMKVCFILYELDAGGIKASFRSNKINVSKFCKKFGGGGHKQAAGFTLFEDIEKIEKKVIKELKKEF